MNIEEYVTSLCEEQNMKISKEATQMITQLIKEYTNELTLEGREVQRYAVPGIGFGSNSLEKTQHIEPYILDLVLENNNKKIIKKIHNNYFQKERGLIA